MKTNLIFVLLLTTAFFLKGQLSIEASLGGSNFLGYSGNVQYQISLNAESTKTIGLRLGAGALFPGWELEPTLLVKSGLNYNYGPWGLGLDMSFFGTNTFQFDQVIPAGTPDVKAIAFPHISYTKMFKNSLYFRISGGADFAFDPGYVGDPIPFAGLAVGVMFFHPSRVPNLK